VPYHCSERSCPNNDNAIRVVNFTTLKILQSSPDGNTHNQTDHVLIDRRRYSSVLDVQSFRAADCDTDHNLVVAKVREGLAANEQRSYREVQSQQVK
jgi:hypothetical protein